jgi:hypothetical protein
LVVWTRFSMDLLPVKVIAKFIAKYQIVPFHVKSMVKKGSVSLCMFSKTWS